MFEPRDVRKRTGNSCHLLPPFPTQPGKIKVNLSYKEDCFCPSPERSTLRYRYSWTVSSSSLSRSKFNFPFEVFAPSLVQLFVKIVTGRLFRKVPPHKLCNRSELVQIYRFPKRSTWPDLRYSHVSELISACLFPTIAQLQEDAWEHCANKLPSCSGKDKPKLPLLAEG